MLLTTVLVTFILCHGLVGAINFDISPDTFVAAVTPNVDMRCDVAGSGSEMSQLLLIQIEVQDRGNMVPMVTLTPGTAPKIMEAGLEKHLTVDGTINQFTNIDQSFLSVGYSFPGIDVAGNYTCVVSGLSVNGLLVRFTETAQLSVGALNLIPHFMTNEVVQLRATIEKLKRQKASLLAQAEQLKQVEQNITQELTQVESKIGRLTNQMQQLKTRSEQLDDILSNSTAELNALMQVRPTMKVAFHAGLSEFGAKPISLAMHTPIKFDHVITNEGNGYDPATGIFRAPVTGTYLFTLSMEAGAGKRYSEMAVMLNDKLLQSIQIADDTDYEHRTTTTIAHAQAGDRVRCEFTWQEGDPGYVGSTRTAAPYVSTFSGYILW